jgi:hypothetical protein
MNETLTSHRCVEARLCIAALCQRRWSNNSRIYLALMTGLTILFFPIDELRTRRGLGLEAAPQNDFRYP